MNKLVILILSSILFISCNSEKRNTNSVITNIEDCDCLSNYHWIKKTFEENDAGFQWAIETKGLTAYQQFCDSIEERIKDAEDIYECNNILNDWGKFFRKGHFSIGLNVGNASNEKISEPETVNYTIQTVYEQLEKTNDNMLGVWVSSPYKIGIVQDTSSSERKYVGFIIDSEAPEWKEGQVKLEIFKRNEQFIGHLYMRDYSIERRPVKLKNDEELSIGNMKYINILKADTLEQKLLSTPKPLFYKLSNKTTLLRIPSFNSDQTKSINKLIEEKKATILSHQNLIIDLRNNAGGSDNSWKEIIPLIYTNPIRTVGVEFLSTSLNRESFKENYSYLQKLFIRKFIKKLESNDGKFVTKDSIYITESDDILPNPQNVIVLVDENCASSVEQFLFAAQQSKKVKIYGKQTFGAIDVSNVVVTLSPDNCFSLGYCISRTLRPINSRVDGVGIMPDFEINDSVPKYQWINYVLNKVE